MYKTYTQKLRDYAAQRPINTLRCSVPLVIRDTEMKTIRYPLLVIILEKIK